MIPKDSIIMPLKVNAFNMTQDLQRVQALVTRKEKGLLTAEDIAKVKIAIRESFENRQSVYKTVGEVLNRTSKLVPSEATKYISATGNTPMHYSTLQTGPTVPMCDDATDLLQNVCVAEFAARNYNDKEIIRRVKDQTGLDYSGCYSQLHKAIEDWQKGDKRKINFIARQLYTENPEQLKSWNDSEISQGIKTIKEDFVNKFSAMPYFPERLVSKGFKFFQTELCKKDVCPEAVQFDGFQMVCPCCVYPKNLQNPSAVKVKCTLRCVFCQKLIIGDYFFVQNEGFCCENCGRTNQGKRIVFQE
ncbi:Conserved_hypothetical protein [Hexamita inflata]|uniref:Uncharacterized protein n=1 Tax=Hexamita inflata TaxID=28002 RepID=A0ABP1GND1_9EUKA